MYGNNRSGSAPPKSHLTLVGSESGISKKRSRIRSDPNGPVSNLRGITAKRPESVLSWYSIVYCKPRAFSLEQPHN